MLDKIRELNSTKILLSMIFSTLIMVVIILIMILNKIPQFYSYEEQMVLWDSNNNEQEILNKQPVIRVWGTVNVGETYDTVDVNVKE